MLLLVTALWTLWGACWLRRVELRREKEPIVQAMGLVWAREGLGPSVCARGMVGGKAVEVRWRRGLWRDRARVRTDGGWRELAADSELSAIGDEEGSG